MMTNDEIPFAPAVTGSQFQTFDAPDLLGFHVNVDPRLQDVELVEFARVYPTTPRCIFAGQEDTVCLLFVDEAEARASAIGHMLPG